MGWKMEDSMTTSSPSAFWVRCTYEGWAVAHAVVGLV